VDAEKFAHEAHVRAPGELHLFRTVMEVELRGEGFGERPRARAAGVDQRAVNVKENEPDHAARKLIAPARGDNAVRAKKGGATDLSGAPRCGRLRDFRSGRDPAGRTAPVAGLLKK